MVDIVDPYKQKPRIVDPYKSTPSTGPRDFAETYITGSPGRPRYQTFPERAVRGVVGSIKDAIDAAYATPPGSTRPEAMVGPAFEAATAFSPMSPGSQIAHEGLAAAKAAMKKATPSQEELATITTGPGQGYKGGIMDVPLKDHVLEDIQKNILDTLHTEHFRDYGAPFVFRAVKELEPVAGKAPTIADIETVRQVLNRAPFDQRAGAMVARNKINEYLAELQPEDVVMGEKNALGPGTGKGNTVTSPGEILSKIRGNYAALSRSERLTEAVEKGKRQSETSGMGANMDNSLRQKIKEIRNSPKLSRGFSKDELKEMDKIIKGGTLTNLARIFSRFGPQHPLTGWGIAGIEGLKHGALLPLATLALGHAAQKYAEHSTLNKIRGLEKSVRRRSPLFTDQGGKFELPPIAPVDSPVLSAMSRGTLAAGPANEDEVSPYLRRQGML